MTGNMKAALLLGLSFMSYYTPKADGSVSNVQAEFARWLLLGDSTMGELVSGIYQEMTGSPFCSSLQNFVPSTYCDNLGDRARLPKLFRRCAKLVQPVLKSAKLFYAGPRNFLVMHNESRLSIRHTFFGTMKNYYGLTNFQEHRTELFTLAKQFVPQVVVIGSGLHDAYCSWFNGLGCPSKTEGKQHLQKIFASLLGHPACLNKLSHIDPCSSNLPIHKTPVNTTKFSMYLNTHVREYLESLRTEFPQVKILVKPNIQLLCNETPQEFAGSWWYRRRVFQALQQEYNRMFETFCKTSNLCIYVWDIRSNDLNCRDGYRKDGFHFGKRINDCNPDTNSISLISNRIIQAASSGKLTGSSNKL